MRKSSMISKPGSITADVGTDATTRILDDLRKRVARKELDDVDALLQALHRAML